ncbi:uncharacterized protein C2845_PM15G11300 [Panicum miliaceum]|uniref:HMA domain-containing protein n=1 Tax=Panicum miliaceum TaxID=4540 RepID=A0A3L6Q9F7_PANMI|nr:uncharacterized protein C2845_PM15G11300 [Panicum miliaceum]
MAKQKIVIKVTMPNAKSRARAMVLAAKASGVGSIGITGDLKDRLEVVGEGVDVACLVHCLRKKLCCHAEIVQVEEVKDKKPAEEEKKVEEPKPCPCPGTCRCAVGYCHAPLPMVLCEDPPAGSCRVM